MVKNEFTELIVHNRLLRCTGHQATDPGRLWLPVLDKKDPKRAQDPSVLAPEIQHMALRLPLWHHRRALWKRWYCLCSRDYDP